MPYMSNKKTHPLFDSQNRRICPVCGTTAYSIAGIHPQCAVRREDDIRMTRLRAVKLQNPINESAQLNCDRAAWQRLCPVCHAVLHARTKICSCRSTAAVAGHVAALKDDAT
ncbi:MAG: hypothetical protein R3C17_03515 [Planctomycetaceae bacterium]